ncbi:major facilitator superfamily domain-containing protein [Thelephora terrestris]|uniref:Major facilitator superfamily domain-containing protein n=1 Tax=Thelephora terrestris TaxID=56493 RepID=A0A9P6LCC6_9AGAM|nr:major facilitator superfamily domain-containing protein [Thelephora terrestris]
MSSERDPLLTIAPRHGANTDESEDEGKLGPLEISHSSRWAILAGIWIATFLGSVNTTLVTTLMPSISSEFNKSHQVSWLGTAYLLAICTFTPIYGRLCHVMGRRAAHQSAVLFGALGTLACGLSPSMNLLIVARFVSGIGGGGILTTSTIITSDMFILRSRGLAQSIGSVFMALGIGIGGPLAGFISDAYGWRAAFLINMPLFFISFILTGYNLSYVTPGKGKTPGEVLRRIDYGGMITTLVWVFATLLFLSYRYNERLPWDDSRVISTLGVTILFFLLFIIVELKFAIEPVLAPFLLKQKIPALIGVSNFLVSFCNFSVMYFFPVWFQTVMLTSAFIAGLHVLPSSTAMAIGFLFAGWSMHKTGKYKFINLTFGILPSMAAVLIVTMNEDSSPARLWLSIIPFGFGNGVVLQTMHIALLAHIPQSAMAVGTGFGQLFRSVGQVGGVAVSSAVFQSVLDSELRNRIRGPDANEIIKRIRESTGVVVSLPPDLQRAARDSYDGALRAVFIMAMCSTLMAYIVRLPIPDRSLDEPEPADPPQQPAQADVGNIVNSVVTSPLDTPFDSDDDHRKKRTHMLGTRHRKPDLTQPRSLSGYEPVDGSMDLEEDTIEGTAQSRA